jgi:hypothetical protein
MADDGSKSLLRLCAPAALKNDANNYPVAEMRAAIVAQKRHAPRHSAIFCDALHAGWVDRDDCAFFAFTIRGDRRRDVAADV